MMRRVTVHSETVRTELHGPVGVIIVDNPPVNAIAPSVRDGIAAAAAELKDDPAASAVVLHCAGNTFMAGADIKKMSAAPSSRTSAEVIQQLEDLSKPLVAALQGNALGGGLEFALGCHYRCAAPATSLGLPEVNLGLIPGAGGTKRLPRLVGVEKALDMIISANQSRHARRSDRLVDRVLEGKAYWQGRSPMRSSSLRKRWSAQDAGHRDPRDPEQVFASAAQCGTWPTRRASAVSAITRCAARSRGSFEEACEPRRNCSPRCATLRNRARCVSVRCGTSGSRSRASTKARY